MGWISKLLGAKPAVPSAPVVAPDVVGPVELLQERHRRELERGVELTKRVRELERQRLEQVFVTEWHADECETHRRELDALLKSRGTVEGLRDASWIERYQAQLQTVMTGETWPARREQLSKQPRERFRKVWEGART